MNSKCGTYSGYKYHKNHKTQPCPECLAANRVYSKIRYQKDGAARQARSRIKNLATVQARERQKNRVRRARQRNNVTRDYNELQVIATYGPNCYICSLAIDFMAPRKTGVIGWENGLHVDHLVPISLGGPDTLENVRPTHGLCNLSKYSNL